jgi:hypothetical protein
MELIDNPLRSPLQMQLEGHKDGLDTAALLG